jgi:hypothetical protein
MMLSVVAYCSLQWPSALRQPYCGCVWMSSSSVWVGRRFKFKCVGFLLIYVGLGKILALCDAIISVCKSYGWGMSYVLGNCSWVQTAINHWIGLSSLYLYGGLFYDRYAKQGL